MVRGSGARPMNTISTVSTAHKPEPDQQQIQAVADSLIQMSQSQEVLYLVRLKQLVDCVSADPELRDQALEAFELFGQAAQKRGHAWL